MENPKLSTYYKDNLPRLINRLKNSVSKIEIIIDDDIDKELKDNVLFNVLKAKRQASEDVVWTLKKIDELENELNGIDVNMIQKEDESNKQIVHPTMRHAKKE